MSNGAPFGALGYAERSFGGVRHLLRHPEIGWGAHSHLTLCGRSATTWPEVSAETYCEVCLSVAREAKMSVIDSSHVADRYSGDMTEEEAQEFVDADRDLRADLEWAASVGDDEWNDPANVERRKSLEANLDARYANVMDGDREARVASHAALVAITERAAELRYNRRLDKGNSSEGEALLDKIDPEAHAILAPVMVHRYAEGRPVEPHVRALAHVMLVGGLPTRPTKRMVDVPMGMWERLLTTEEMYDLQPDVRARRDRSDAAKRDREAARRRLMRGHRSR